MFTVVTQFLTDDGTATGVLSEIKRFYVQNGVTIANAESDIAGVSGNSITEDFCTAQKTAFGDNNTFAAHGGFSSMSKAMESGMVLVMSLWDDYYANMAWLDSNDPTTGDASTPGVARGTCSTSSGVPATVEADGASSKVIFSNIKVGAINSTFSAAAGSSGTTESSPSSAVGTSSTANLKSSSTVPDTQAITPSSNVVAVSSPVNFQSTTSISKANIVTSSPVVSTANTAVATPVCKPKTSTLALANSFTQLTASTLTTAGPSSATDVSTGSGTGLVAAHYYQCGGINWNGATECESGYTCTEQNDYYSQCL